jgi:hypothetical protein
MKKENIDLLPKVKEWSLKEEIVTEEEWNEMIEKNDTITLGLAIATYQLYNEPDKLEMYTTRYTENDDGIYTSESVDNYFTESFEEAKARHTREDDIINIEIEE